MTNNNRDVDVVLFGASGFLGGLVAQYLAESAPPGLRVGLAGRSIARLQAVRGQLGAAAATWPLIAADVTDPSSLAALARATRVIATTVGPYRPHGLALVEACTAAGTHYADVTGEVLFVRDSIDRYHDRATRAGTRIVHCCGVDSIPSDLAVLVLHQAALADGAGELEDVTLVVTRWKGHLGGGTLVSIEGILDEVRASERSRRLIEDPYALSPERSAEPDLGDERDLSWIKHDDDLGIWVGPFVMAGVNTRIVRRSNALSNWAYGRKFRYREVSGYGSALLAPVQAVAATTAMMGLVTGVTFLPSRGLLHRVLPAPGEGPSEKARRAGSFRMELHARTSLGARYIGEVDVAGDPGFAATSVMLGESALCLAMDGDRLPPAAGVLTPATALGTALVDRVRAAGITLTTRRITPH